MMKSFMRSIIYYFIGFSILAAFAYYLIKNQSLTYATSLSISFTIFAYIATIVVSHKIHHFLFNTQKRYIIPILLILYLLVLPVILVLKDLLATKVFISGFIFNVIWLYTISFLITESKKLNFLVLHNFNYDFLKNKPMINYQILDSGYVFSNTTSIDAVLLDTNSLLNSHEKSLLIKCEQQKIKAIDASEIKEMVLGKIDTSLLKNTSQKDFQPSQSYLLFKYLWESLLIISLLPIIIPVMLITAISIKISSKGPIFFNQERIGQNGKVFKMFKFRSMTVNSPNHTSKFATEEQARITKIGKIIRKFRIDELPQLFNVLLGDMALIGPRPEQDSFVQQFSKEIPFYDYRHIVKPGITGWAQTVQGYADDTESTKEKLSFDLYYIKNVSFWLDLNILFKTARTVLTGFGAK